MIVEIERLEVELHAMTFRDSEGLVQREVPLAQAGRAQDVEADVSYAVISSGSEQ